MLIFNSKAVVERRGFRPKIFDETTQKKTQPPRWEDWVFWLSIDFKGPKRYRAGENR